jgi:alkylhydroperoxidase family enzyme
LEEVAVTGQRFVIGLLSVCCRMLWGFVPRMIPVIVQRKGALGALTWFAANMPRMLSTMRVLGPMRTHLACVVISLYNSCGYCAFGHAYALELLYFRDRDQLFPLDARTLEAWLHLPPRELSERLRDVLSRAGLHTEALWVDRTLGLVTGDQQPIDGAEARLAHLVRMVGAMNRLANEAGVEPDQAHDPINKDSTVKHRHEAMRAVAA